MRWELGTLADRIDTARVAFEPQVRPIDPLVNRGVCNDPGKGLQCYHTKNVLLQDGWLDVHSRPRISVFLLPVLEHPEIRHDSAMSARDAHEDGRRVFKDGQWIRRLRVDTRACCRTRLPSTSESGLLLSASGILSEV